MDNTKNITPYNSSTPQYSRMKITGSCPSVFWMTGLSGAGKSTVAALAEKMLNDMGISAYMIDGDTVRCGLCAGLGFTVEDRHENLRRIAELAMIVADSGQTVIVCTISPDEESRSTARKIIEKKAEFHEVYLKASVEVCAARDPKGLYKKAFAGDIKNFTGVSAPYEVPENPDVVLDTASLTAEECASSLVEYALDIIRKPEQLTSEMICAAIAASEKILSVYNGDYEVTFKDDKSPLTTADTMSNEVITTHFRSVFPEYSILSEEEADSLERLSNNAGVFIIDPIDGTKEFISRNGEFCVSIGFASHHKVIGGVIAVPAKGLIYYAFEGMGAYRMTFDEFTKDWVFGDGTRLHVSSRTGSNDDDRLIITASRSHMDKQTEMLFAKNESRIGDSITAGSCLKGCMIAEGRADIHYRFGAFMKEWDTAAMQIICEEAGAIFTDLDGNPLRANREDPVNRRGFIILNRPESALDIDGIE